jgi:prevent-host-death family protein
MNVGIKELKEHLSEILARAREGETVEVTWHRKPIARIVGIPSTPDSGLTAFAAGGGFSWAGGKPKLRPPESLSPGKPVSESILEDRR